MTSTRLPGKVLMDLGGRPALEQMLRRVRCSMLLDEIAVATTVNVSDDPVADLCARMGIPVFRGDEDDVLGRYLGAALAFQADNIVRLTADCPMHDASVIDLCIDQFMSGSYDYLSNVITRSYPDGLDVEIFTLQALQQIDKEAQSDFWREHVTTYFREPSNPGGFQLGSVVHDQDFANLRWTLDTVEDLDLIRRYFGALPDKFSWLEALELARKIEQVRS